MFKRLFAWAELFGKKPEPAPFEALNFPGVTTQEQARRNAKRGLEIGLAAAAYDPAKVKVFEVARVDHQLSNLERERDRLKRNKKAWRPVQAKIDALKAGQ